MHRLPRSSGGQGSDDYSVNADALQKWLWNLAATGWTPTGDNLRWSHDDNMAVQHLGWMIVNVPGSPYLDLFTLRPGATPQGVMKTIANAATLDPMCAKAVAVLGGQRLKHPEVQFNYME